MVKDIKLYTPHIDETVVDDLLAFSKTADFKHTYTDIFGDKAAMRKNAAGGTAMYLPYNDDIGVLYSTIFNHETEDNFKKIIDETWKLYDNGAKVAPVLGFARGLNEKGFPNDHYKVSNLVVDFAEKRDIVFVARAAGDKVLDTTAGERLKNPDEHYTGLVQTFWDILKSELHPDIHGENIITHPTGGYNYIDWNALNYESFKTRFAPQTEKLLQTFLYTKKSNYADTIKEQQIIVEKLLNIGIQPAQINPAIVNIKELKSATVDELLAK